MIAAIFVLDAKRRTTNQKNQARRREKPRQHKDVPVAIVEVAREEDQNGKRYKQRGVYNDLPVHGLLKSSAGCQPH